jgi:hypothetical protein
LNLPDLEQLLLELCAKRLLRTAQMPDSPTLSTFGGAFASVSDLLNREEFIPLKEPVFALCKELGIAEDLIISLGPRVSLGVV